MYLIKDRLSRYLKISIDNKITYTPNECLATPFPSEREATDFLKKMYNKKSRKMFKVVKENDTTYPDFTTVSNQVNQNQDKVVSANNKDSTNRYEQCVKDFNKSISTYLSPEITEYVKQVKTYDNMILDIRHFLRREDTKLNACQGYIVVKKLQVLERERAACKKELQRLLLLKTSVRQAIKEADEFDYVEYKNREIINVREYLFG